MSGVRSCLLGLATSAILLSCQSNFRGETDEEPPLAVDHGGRPRAWETCEPIAFELSRKFRQAPAVYQPVEEAFKAWSLEGIPRLRLLWGPDRTANEDGHNTVEFTTPRRLCTGAHKAGCLFKDWGGLTELMGTPGDDKRSNTLEADIRLDIHLLNQPERLREVLMHELGHVLGLDHSSEHSLSAQTIMSPNPKAGYRRPGALDVRVLRRLYRKQCAK